MPHNPLPKGIQDIVMSYLQEPEKKYKSYVSPKKYLRFINKNTVGVLDDQSDYCKLSEPMKLAACPMLFHAFFSAYAYGPVILGLTNAGILCCNLKTSIREEVEILNSNRNDWETARFFLTINPSIVEPVKHEAPEDQVMVDDEVSNAFYSSMPS